MLGENMPFKLIREDCDTRINEYPESYFREGEEKYETFEEAQKHAVKYLENLIVSCQETLEWIKGRESEH